jgi:hypothetical protein
MEGGMLRIGIGKCRIEGMASRTAAAKAAVDEMIEGAQSRRRCIRREQISVDRGRAGEAP